MLKNYTLLIFRTLRRNFSYSLINILGFAISLACCFIISLFVKTELSFDNFHANKDRIYRYIPRHIEEGQTTMQTWTATGLAPLLGSSFPADLEKTARYTDWDANAVLRDGERTITLSSISLADSSFFNIFSFPFVTGDPSRALSRPLTMVISRSEAEKNFPGENPVGKVVRYANVLDFEITGVFEDLPLNSHLQFTALFSMISLKQLRADWEGDILNNFDSWNYTTYLLASPKTNIDELQHQASAVFYERYTNGRKRPANDTDDWLQPLSAIHFTAGVKGDGPIGDIRYVYMAVSLGVVILLISCFNFMNLSTAMAMKRAKEVGLRKTLGAMKNQLVRQFLGEAFVQVLLSIVLAFLFVQFFLPVVQVAFGINLVRLLPSEYVLIFGAFILLTTLLAGGYPAFYLSSFRPSNVLKGAIAGDSRSTFRKTLIVFQFTVSIFLLAGTAVVYSQLRYLLDKNLGFKKDGIATIYITPAVKNKFEEFKQALLSHSGIEDVTVSSQRLGNLQSYWRYTFPNGEYEGSLGITTLIVDDNYLDFMGIEVKEGRKLSRSFATDATTAFVVNEAFVNEYGLSRPLETYVQVVGDPERRGTIVGVVKDFYFRPLHNAVTPIVIRMDDRNLWLVSIRISGENMAEGIAALGTEWQKFTDGRPLDYEFLDDYVAENYLAERRASSFLMTLTGFAIFIAGLGLLGLTAFMTAQRRKEIGIRKVLGSSVGQIVQIFSRDVFRLLVISFVIATPLAWVASDRWLQNFAYRIEVNPLMLVAAGLTVMIFSLLIIGYQSVKAGRENPTEALRSE